MRDYVIQSELLNIDQTKTEASRLGYYGRDLAPLEKLVLQKVRLQCLPEIKVLEIAVAGMKQEVIESEKHIAKLNEKIRSSKTILNIFRLIRIYIIEKQIRKTNKDIAEVEEEIRLIVEEEIKIIVSGLDAVLELEFVLAQTVRENHGKDQIRVMTY